jgi:hypothetical protein
MLFNQKNKKIVGEKHFKSVNDYSDNSSIIPINNNDMIKVIDTPEYRTRGESILLIKDVDTCKIILDSTNTFSIKIKTLTKVVIIPFMGKIDDEYDEIFIDKGACVELYFMSGGWYILSSDGLKLGD